MPEPSSPTSSGGSSKAAQVVNTAMEYVNRGNPYAYGGSGQPLTTENVNSLASTFSGNSDAYYEHLRPGGKDYSKVGQSGMECVDCSGLTQKVFKSVGVNIPRVASDQYNCGPDVGWQNAQPGDLVVRQGHASIMGNNGNIIEAKGWSWGCTNDRKPDSRYKAIRLVSGGASVTTSAPTTTSGGGTTTTGGGTTTTAGGNFNVTSAVNYNNSRGYSVAEWKMIQTVVGTDVDGIPGKMTATAIYNWQLAHNLEADGKCGPITFGAIQAAYSGGSTTTGGSTTPSTTTETPAPATTTPSTTEGGSGGTDTATTAPSVPTTSEAGVGAKRSSLATNWVDFGTIRSSARTQKISKITIHHTAGTGDATGYAKYHRDGDRDASANYYIGKSGDICGGVEENRRAWTSSSKSNDQQAITIEVSNSKKGEPWPISDASYHSLIALCQDLCSRHNISPHFDGTPSGSLTAHYMFASTACPGPTIKGMLSSGKIENDIKNGATSSTVEAPDTTTTGPATTTTTTTPAPAGSISIDVSSAVAYNKKRGYSKDTWKKIQAQIGTDVDGDPGPKTANALAVWQQSHGLEVDGKCGPATLGSFNLGSDTTTTTSGGSTSTSTDMSEYSGGSGAGYPTIATWNQEPIFKYFVNEVYADHPAKKAIAAGFLGNIYTESHYQQDAEQCPGKKGSGGKGIIQWDDRKYNLYNYCGSDYNDRKWVDLAKQLEFAKYELNGSEKSADKSIRNSVSSDSASAARIAAHTIAKKFERPANPDNIERQDKAEENYNKFA